jgi:hypothetical protein
MCYLSGRRRICIFNSGESQASKGYMIAQMTAFENSLNGMTPSEKQTQEIRITVYKLEKF